MESSKKQRPKRRLDRRNAIKNINYKAAASLEEVEDSDSASAPCSFRTHSLDLSVLATSSFRIVGGSDGEIDRICWSLGLSGPEDFGIPTAAWEARKIRSSSSDISPLSSTSKLKEKEEDKKEELLNRFEAGLSISDAPVPTTPQVFDNMPTRQMTSSSSSSIKSGIKGVRPPLLAPPPSILLPPTPIDGSSTWDLLKAFGPPPSPRGNTNTPTSSTSKARILDTDTDTDDENVEQEEEEEVIRLGETVHLLSESCSFSTSNDDDDSSSTTTDPMYIISPNAIARFRRNINSWIKGNLLGSGSFGTVYEGLSDDGFFFAVKEVSLLDQGIQAKQSIYQLEQEISLLSQFEHENIVQYYGTDKDEEKLYIFLELVTQGSLAQLYQKYHLPETLVSAYTRQILRGLKYLHDRNVVHRDVKCANILVDANGSVKLADFGLAKATKFNDVKSCKGTAFWMAPEVVNRRSNGYGLPADIWSLGCTVLEMLTRQLPYSNLECMQALFRIGKGKPPPVPDSISGAAHDFILQCLQVNADDRPTAAKLLDHPFVERPLSASSASASPSHNNWRRT